MSINRNKKSEIVTSLKYFAPIILLAAIGAATPPLIFFNKIKLDEPLFVTEWLKIWFECVVIGVIIEAIIKYRQAKEKTNEDTEKISNNAIFFIDECVKNLSSINFNTNSSDFEILAKKASLCWEQVDFFFTNKSYFNTNNREVSIEIFYLHNEIINNGTLSRLGEYFKKYQNLDEFKVPFIISSLNDIKDNLKASLL